MQKPLPILLTFKLKLPVIGFGLYQCIFEVKACLAGCLLIGLLVLKIGSFWMGFLVELDEIRLGRQFKFVFERLVGGLEWREGHGLFAADLMFVLELWMALFAVHGEVGLLPCCVAFAKPERLRKVLGIGAQRTIDCTGYYATAHCGANGAVHCKYL